MNCKKSTESGLSLHKVITLGIVLLIVIGIVTGYYEIDSMSDLAKSTVNTMKKQCMIFDKLTVADRTKSLFRLTDMVGDFNIRLESDPLLANNEYLEQYVANLRMSGIVILDENLAVESEGYTRSFIHTSQKKAHMDGNLKNIMQYPNKIYMERIQKTGEYYDVCAVSRKDKKGIIIGFYHQPTGLVSVTVDDMKSILSDIRIEHDGKYAIVENRIVRAANEHDLVGRDIASNSVYEKISKVKKDGKTHLIYSKGKCYLGYRSASDGYILYLYYPITSAVSTLIVSVALSAAIYFIICFVYFAMRNKNLSKNQKKLEESNKKLIETVTMLKSLETLYFSMFYINVNDDTYETIYIAPWLKDSASDKGSFTQLKTFFVDSSVADEFKNELLKITDCDYICQKLSRDNENDINKNFYFDYQEIRGEKRRWCRITVAAVNFDDHGVPIHIIALLQDVDKEKRKEAEYQARIIKEAGEAKVANNAKADFLRQMSHDIRTPLNGIRGYFDIAARHPDDIDLQVHCREGAQTSVNTLLELVNSILDMSTLEGNAIKLEKRKFDLTELLDEMNTVLIPQATVKNVKYIVERSSRLSVSNLIGSPRHVRQIIMNITGNAIKYTNPGGMICVDTKLISRTDKEVTYEFICRDNGIGMSDTFQKHMFEPFTQEAVNARSTYEGAGLGLSIVKRLVDALGGTIEVDSEKDKGTTFHTRLTFEIDREFNNEQMDDNDLTVLKKKHILIAEDNELNMDIAVFLLEECGAIVTKAWNGIEVYKAFEASEPYFYDMILMDIMMPQMNGIDAARTIRSLDRPDAKSVPIAAMSANAFDDDIAKTKNAGMNMHIAKPIDKSKILNAVRKFFGSRTN